MTRTINLFLIKASLSVFLLFFILLAHITNTIMVFIGLVGIISFWTIVFDIKNPIFIEILTYVTDTIAILILLVWVVGVWTNVKIVGYAITINILVTDITDTIAIDIALIRVEIELAIVTHITYPITIAIGLPWVISSWAVVIFIGPSVTIHVIVFLVGDSIVVNIRVTGQSKYIALLIVCDVLVRIPYLRTDITGIAHSVTITVKLFGIRVFWTYVALITYAIMIPIILIRTMGFRTEITPVTISITVCINLVDI